MNHRQVPLVCTRNMHVGMPLRVNILSVTRANERQVGV